MDARLWRIVRRLLIKIELWTNVREKDQNRWMDAPRTKRILFYLFDDCEKSENRGVLFFAYRHANNTRMRAAICEQFDYLFLIRLAMRRV